MVLLWIVSPLVFSSEYREVSWGDLVPKDWLQNAPTEQDFFESGLEPQTIEAPVVAALNKQKLKIAGYILPIKYSGMFISEFLLVPTFGACIHTPPPPENQMIYVSMEEPVEIATPWAPVWVSGLLSAQKSHTKFATAGYQMKGANLEAMDFSGQ
jgi:hypothetical protein